MGEFGAGCALITETEGFGLFPTSARSCLPCLPGLSFVFVCVGDGEMEDHLVQSAGGDDAVEGARTFTLALSLKEVAPEIELRKVARELLSIDLVQQQQRQQQPRLRNSPPPPDEPDLSEDEQLLLLRVHAEHMLHLDGFDFEQVDAPPLPDEEPLFSVGSVGGDVSPKQEGGAEDDPLSLLDVVRASKAVLATGYGSISDSAPAAATDSPSHAIAPADGAADAPLDEEDEVYMAGLATPAAVRNEMALLLAETRAASYDDDEFDEHEIADAVADADADAYGDAPVGPPAQGELTPLRRATSSPPRPVNANSPTSKIPVRRWQPPPKHGSRRAPRLSCPSLLRRRRRCNRRRRRRRRLRLRLCLRRRRAAHRAVTVDASAAAVTSCGRTAGVAIAPHGGGTGPAAPVVSRHRRVGPLLTATPDGRARPIVGALPPSGRPCLHVARTGGKPRGAACGGGGVGGAVEWAHQRRQEMQSLAASVPDAEERCARLAAHGSVGVVASPLELLASAPSEWGEDVVPTRAVPDLRATRAAGTERDGRGTPTKQAQPSRGHGRPPHPQWRPLVPLPDHATLGVGGASPGFASGPPPPVTTRTDRVGWQDEA